MFLYLSISSKQTALYLFLLLFSDFSCFEIFSAQDETVTQILFTHNLVFGKFFGGTLEQNLSFEQQIGTVGNTQGFLHVVVGNQNTDVLIFQLLDNVLNVFYGNQIGRHRQRVRRA